MFPLGSVLFPHGVIPLRIFEPRYLQMIAECVQLGEPFGVVLIERGFEVGGGEKRHSLGTLATIVETAVLTGGHEAVVAVGTDRFEVREWLTDDPYPRAVIERIEEPVERGLTENIERVGSLLVSAYALLSESGIDTGGFEYQPTADPTVSVFHMATLAPIGPFDAQRILAAPTTADRLDLLEEALIDKIELLRSELAG